MKFIKKIFGFCDECFGLFWTHRGYEDTGRCLKQIFGEDYGK